MNQPSQNLNEKLAKIACCDVCRRPFPVARWTNDFIQIDCKHDGTHEFLIPPLTRAALIEEGRRQGAREAAARHARELVKVASRLDETAIAEEHERLTSPPVSLSVHPAVDDGAFEEEGDPAPGAVPA